VGVNGVEQGGGESSANRRVNDHANNRVVPRGNQDGINTANSNVNNWAVQRASKDLNNTANKLFNTPVTPQRYILTFHW
jgi:hypothetical protein